jgi:hypothetical protein
MYRRQLRAYDDRVHKPFYHQTTPRKWRSFNYAENVSTRAQPAYRPSLLYGGDWDRASQLRQMWVGKKIVYWQGESLPNYSRRIIWGNVDPPGVVNEFEIASVAQPYIYRIIYVDRLGKWRSKPDISYRAGRLNIMVDQDDIIRDVGYF